MMSIFTGVTGLRAQQEAVDVIANNIANVNTIGFKAGRASFQEALSQTIRGAYSASGGRGGANPIQVGLGVQVGSVDNLMTQGNLKSTGRVLDIAIEGNGFFAVSDGVTNYYTRDGNFGLDANNVLVMQGSGLTVLGWQADPVTGELPTNTMITADSSITIPLGSMSVARGTANVAYQANLDAEAAAGTAVDTSFYVYDSLGSSHRVDLTMTKTATDGQWTWETSSPDADPAVANSTGTLVFDADGQITTPSGSVSIALLSDNGASNPLLFDIDFSGITQLSGDSNVQAVSQDGLPAGTLQSIAIDRDGTIVGQFSNGLFRNIAKIALARFSNPAGLNKMGKSLYTPSINSGEAAIVWAETSDSGKVASGYLEMSNVDLASEFANLIVTQRGFTANSRVITTSDEMLQDVLTLKR
jgi:flagellar hook protein FlgE